MEHNLISRLYLLFLASIIALAGCRSAPEPMVEAAVELPDSALVSFDREAWIADRPNPGSIPEAAGGWWAVCYCGHGVIGGPYRFQDQAERVGRAHDCEQHMCARCCDVQWNSLENAGHARGTVAPSEERLIARDQRCNDARCCWFNQPVSPGHQHSYRCSDARCCVFNQCVSSGHQHSYRCGDARCCIFNQCVPPNHQHSYRCGDARCTMFNQCVPPNHVHSPRQ